MIKNIWFEYTCAGAILLSSGGGPSASIQDCFFQSDLGLQPVTAIAVIYAISVINLLIKNGYGGGLLQNPTPVYIFDNCQNVFLDGIYIANAGREIINLQNQSGQFNEPVGRVKVSSVQGAVPFYTFAGYTTWGVTNGSAFVPASDTIYQYDFTVGQYLQFTSQPNTTYKVTHSDIPTGNLTITPAYSGTTNAATSIISLGFPWMPEDGYAGQGPLLLTDQESFGINIVNIIAAGSMTLWINDFLWKVIKITDVNVLLSGTVNIILPLIAGYQRTFINGTAQSLIFKSSTGTGITVVAGAHGNCVCDGTNWISI
jgi:hypothetical protein